MVEEVLDYLRPERGGVYFDGTVGGGGHGEAILAASSEACLIGVDQDREAIEVAAGRLARFGDRVELRQVNYDTAVETVPELAGALLDLGVSSRQIDDPARGFSFRPGTPLDMRMDAASGGPTAADLLNTLSQRELADIIYRYGDERRSRRLAAEMVRRRARQPFRVSDDLVACVVRGLGARTTVQDKARIFQALRIAVNDELSSLERGLPKLRDRLVPRGVLVVLAYHSVEDRCVKESFREWSRSCICPPELPVCQCRGRPLGETLTRRPVVPAGEERERNPRSRSARLRAWRKAA